MEGKNESKHTPGWEIDISYKRDDLYFTVVTCNENPVATATGHNKRIALERAELIASAPALLEENKNMQAEISELLAVMHRDGGHYQVKVGTIQAIKDAKELLFTEWQSSDQIESLRAEVDRLKNDLKHSEERADQRLDSYTKMANYATDFKVEVDRLTKEKSEILEASQLIVDALVQSNAYMKELVGGVFGEHALKNYEDLLTRIKS